MTYLKHWDNAENELKHIGTETSGRYPRGSGEDPNQRSVTFLSNYRKLHAEGLSDKEIADGMGISTSQLRARRSIESDAERAATIGKIVALKEHGNSNVKIGEMMGVNESVVRSMLKQAETNRVNDTKNTANVLQKAVDEKGFIDVGLGIERELGVSQTKLNTAIAMLKEKGYEAHTIKVEQATNKGQFTTVKVLAPPGTKWADINFNKDKIQYINEYSPDDGKTFNMLQTPKSLSSDRIKIRYDEEGGTKKDGVIELRRGVDDISLGNSSYAQVRIAVDGTHFLKGMAMYSDDMPPGVDVIFNTNKGLGTPKEKVFKTLLPDMSDPKAKAITAMKIPDSEKEDLLKKGVTDGSIKPEPDNPFGATIKAKGQRSYIDSNGKEQLGVINKLKEEGDWDSYSKSLSSQMLSKQHLSLINRQLKLSIDEKKAEFDNINALTLPAVKKRLLESFADDCDAAAVHLKAAALPRQTSKVILPISSLKDNEVYAPTYNNGEKVVLIRYPHGGTFEIPELIVNNRQPKAKSILGNAIDAIGINSKVAEQLSGADFDGDSVIVIPVNDRVKINTSARLKDLKDFDPKSAYRGYEGMKPMTSRQKGIEMGKASNLITDMTLKGAVPEELARAVKHSMVVIDAEKHNLDYKKSEKDSGIRALKERYQGRYNAGASTLISRSSSTAYVKERKKFVYDIDPETGKKIYKETGRSYVDKTTGKTIVAKEKSSKMAETDNAFTLSSGTLIENAYAVYANKLKALGNQSRKELITVKTTQGSPSAKDTYKLEVASLNAKLNTALLNSPKERKANIIAAVIVDAKKKDNPEMDKEAIKKESQRQLAAARVRLGANKKDVQVVIDDREWEAIQNGAISDNKLSKILNNTDLDAVRKRATPKAVVTMNSSKVSRMNRMYEYGYTIAEIADQLGESTSTITKQLTAGKE